MKLTDYLVNLDTRNSDNPFLSQAHGLVKLILENNPGLFQFAGTAIDPDALCSCIINHPYPSNDWREVDAREAETAKLLKTLDAIFSKSGHLFGEHVRQAILKEW